MRAHVRRRSAGMSQFDEPVASVSNALAADRRDSLANFEAQASADTNSESER